MVLEWDRSLFLWLREVSHSAWGDVLFPWLTDADHFRIPLLVLWLLLMILGGGKGRMLGLLLALTLLLTDQISSSVLKPWVDRTRPCFEIEGVVSLIPQSRSPSFPSAHAANSFGIAVLLGLTFRRWAWSLLILAATISFSRIYVGVHYPSDILGGALLGAGVAWLVRGCFKAGSKLLALRKGVSPREPADSRDPPFGGRWPHREVETTSGVLWPRMRGAKSGAPLLRTGGFAPTWGRLSLPRWGPLYSFRRL